MIEQIAAVLPDWAELFFYRTHDGTEAELVIARAGVPEILIELKNSTSPKPSRGFYIAGNDLQTKRKYVISPVEKGFSYREDVQIIGYQEISAMFEYKKDP